MAAVGLEILGGTAAYLLYGLFSLGRWLLRVATGRPALDEFSIRLPRGLHVAGIVSSTLAALILVFVIWASHGMKLEAERDLARLYREHQARTSHAPERPLEGGRR